MGRGWGGGEEKVRKCRADMRLPLYGAEKLGLGSDLAWLAWAGEGVRDQGVASQPPFGAPDTIAECPPPLARCQKLSCVQDKTPRAFRSLRAAR